MVNPFRFHAFAGWVALVAAEALSWIAADERIVLVGFLNAASLVATLASVADRNERMLFLGLVVGAAGPGVAVFGHDGTVWVLFPCGVLLLTAAELLAASERCRDDTGEPRLATTIGEIAPVLSAGTAPVVLAVVAGLVEAPFGVVVTLLAASAVAALAVVWTASRPVSPADRAPAGRTPGPPA